MNAWLLGSLADSRCREMRRGAAGRRERSAPRPGSPTPLERRWPRMRRQVGYALVEAGMRLLATAGPAPRG